LGIKYLFFGADVEKNNAKKQVRFAVKISPFGEVLQGLYWKSQRLKLQFLKSSQMHRQPDKEI
jgi:hypothetical protein